MRGTVALGLAATEFHLLHYDFRFVALHAVLAFIAKLSIVDRWLKLDEESGRRMFRSLVAEIKENHKFENKEIQ